MRNVINISLPYTMVKEVKKEVKSGNYVSVSEFFRHLLREWIINRDIIGELEESRRELAAGKAKLLHSLKDLR